jgi:hypothetical protein
MTTPTPLRESTDNRKPDTGRSPPALWRPELRRGIAIAALAAVVLSIGIGSTRPSSSADAVR